MKTKTSETFTVAAVGSKMSLKDATKLMGQKLTKEQMAQALARILAGHASLWTAIDTVAGKGTTAKLIREIF